MTDSLPGSRTGPSEAADQQDLVPVVTRFDADGTRHAADLLVTQATVEAVGTGAVPGTEVQELEPRVARDGMHSRHQRPAEAAALL